jgi:phenylacetate-CoA ligase
VFPRSVIVPFYGLSEKVAFATEVVGRPDAYEFNPIYGLAELVNDKGQIVTEPGQRGKIVGTGFISVGMPFIRYDTEDEATLEQAPSPENGYVLTVRDIGSRWRQEFLVSTNGALVSIAAINIHSQAYRSVREFQFYQDEPGRALLRVILADGATGAHAEVFADEIRKKIAGSIDIAVELTDRIDATQRGKRKFIDQRISQLPLIDTG